MPQIQQIKYDLLILLVTVLVLVLAGLFLTENDQAIFFAGQALSPLCWIKRLTGVACPTCGLSRSFVAWLNGNAARAWQAQPLSILLLALLVFQIPYRWWIIFTGRRMRLFSTRIFVQSVSYILLGLFLLNWIVRLVRG
jgi:hypothetical protein